MHGTTDSVLLTLGFWEVVEFSIQGDALQMTETNTPAAPPPAATPEPATPAPHKYKVRKPQQRACDEKDDKGKVCCGHLKRWYDYPADVEATVGKGAELYRCENCKTLYRPNPKEMPRSYTQRY